MDNAPFPSKRLSQTQWLLPLFSIVLVIAACFWIITFKIMDRDFWWHITAGKIMLQTHQLIIIDPFAFTRAGMPYTSTHEWLAQIVLFLVYHFTGPIGTILFRGVIAGGCALLLLFVSPRKLWPNVFLVIWAIAVHKGSFLERPQLFTYLFFALSIFLAFRFLTTESARSRLWMCVGFILIELLWINMHGAAALLGFAIVGFLLLQTLTGFTVPWERKETLRTIWLLGGTIAVMALSLLLPPNGLKTITYLSSLLNDQTIQFIAEWQPSTWVDYWSHLWLFWLLAPLALLIGRRHVLFSILLLAAGAYLSRQAVRHEILFTFAATGTVFYQLDASEGIATLWSWIARRRLIAFGLSGGMIFFLAFLIHARAVNYERADNLFGFGTFDLAKGAYDFLEKEQITGKMFNTYGIGGYLIYRGYLNRKVFIDGRNVDYGFDFMTRTYAAGVNAVHWKELEEKYGVTYALVDYDIIRLQDRIPYSMVLDKDPTWHLVFIDDWVAVYLKDTAQNKPVIDRLSYKFLTATALQFNDGFDQVPEKSLPALRAELEHMRADSADGIKAIVALAKLDTRENKLKEARELVQEAMRRRPYAAEPVAVLAGTFVQEQDWKNAADAYRTLLSLTGSNYPNLNYGFLAAIFEKAGDSRYARRLRMIAGGEPSQPTASGAVGLPAASGTGKLAPAGAGSGALAVNPASDALAFNEEGLAQIEKEQYDQAAQSFNNAITLSPRFAQAWNNLCAVNLTLKKFTDAVDACKRAVGIDAKFADAHFNLALAYYRTAQYQEAEKQARLAKKYGRIKESDELLDILQNRR